MHDSVLQFTSRMINKYSLDSPEFNVLEVGSMDINGSVRSLFPKVKSYLGTDMREGPGVDFVVDSCYLENSIDPVDMIICTEVLEHCRYFWITMNQFKRILKDKGYLLLTARGVNSNNDCMFIHDYPSDFYRYTPEAWPVLAELAGCEILEFEEDQQHPGGLMLARRLNRI